MEEKISKDIKKKGYQIFNENKIKKEFETEKRVHFLVEGESEKHSVIFDKEKSHFICDCKFSTLKEGMCSHAYAAKLLREKEKNS
jgi:hypothetical protein